MYDPPSVPASSNPPPPPPPAPGKKTGCLQGCLFAFAGVGALVVFSFLAMFLTTFLTIGTAVRQFEGVAGLHNFRQGFQQQLSDSPEDAYSFLNEVWVTGPRTASVKAVHITVRGGIFLNDASRRPLDEGTASDALRAIRRASQDSEVKALLLDIDSGGGGITASDILYDALQKFKASDPERVIVVMMGDVAASGAYYISLPANRILAHPTTITGSIGVIMGSVNIKELAAKIGIRDVTFKSGDNKDLLNPMRDMTPEQEALLQTLVDQMHERFVGLVAFHRRLPLERAKEIADGRIYLAAQAKELGLIDAANCYSDDAFNAVRELCGTTHVKFVRYSQTPTFFDLFRSPSFWGSVLSEAIPNASANTPMRLE